MHTSDYMISQPPHKPIIEVYGCMHALLTQERIGLGNFVIYLDESGGAHTSEPLLRRSGWGLAILRRRTGSLQHDVEFVGGVAGTVEGASQTANRAAVSALEFICRRGAGHIEVGPDSKYVVTGFNGRLRHRSPTGPNADLWHAIYMALTDQHATLHVRKTTSRLEQKRKDFYTAPDIDLPDFAGNFAADSFADRAAEISAGDMGNANLGVSFLRARATAILKRLVEIQRVVSLRLEEDTSSLARPVVVPRAPLLARLLQTTSHTLVMPNSAFGLDDLPPTLRCSVCLQHASRPNFAGWLRKSVGQGSAHKQRAFCSAGANTVVTGHSSLRAGRADSDSSHLIMTRGGIWWCGKCGAFSADSARRITTKTLKAGCTGRPTNARAYALRRLWKGLPPRPSMAWRDDDDGCGKEQQETILPRPRYRIRSKQRQAFLNCLSENDDPPPPALQEQSMIPFGGEEDPFGHMLEGI